MRTCLLVALLLLLLSTNTASKEDHDRNLFVASSSTYSKCDLTSSIRHDTWHEQTFTNSPVLFPTNDDELCEVILTAKNNGCKVRVRGAGHSEDGVVMQKLDELLDVVVVHLKDYTPTDVADDGSTGESWNGVLETDSVKVPTGWSTLELMATIRPRGYLTKTNTAGRFFSVGGAYLNPSVNGNVIDESRYAAQVRSVRAMDADCNTKVYSGEEVKDWRGSVGLLGVVTAVEIDVVPDTGLTMTRSSLSVQNFDKNVVRAWIEEEYNNHNGVEFIWWPYADEIDALEMDFSGGTPIDPASTQAYYDGQIAKNPDTSYVGGDSAGLAQFAELVAGIIESDKNIAKLVSQIGRDEQNKQFERQAQMPRDGYFVEPDQVPQFKVLTANIPCASDCVDESTDLFEAAFVLLQQVKDTSFGNWYPNMPLEWRVYTVQPNEMTLEHLQPGKYVSFDQLALRVGTDGLASSRFLKELEDKWRKLFPDTAIHHGKGYGYQNLPGYGNAEDAVQYQNEEILDSVYTPAVQEAFKLKMQEYDPTGMFAAGSFLRLLGMTSDKFTPRQYVGDKCFEFGNGDCISGCCGKVFFSTIHHVCAATGKDLNEECSETCECDAGLTCQWGMWGPFPWEWFYACRE